MANPSCGRCTFCVRGSDNVCPSSLLPAHRVFGGYAEYILIPEYGALKAPSTISYEKLACLLWAYPTILTALENSAKLRAGESILVTGASGGLGIATIQLAKLSGAMPIIALSSDPSKREQLLATGADVVLNWRDTDVEAQIRAKTLEGLGVDVVIDNVGGKMAKLGLDSARLNGRVVLLAPMGGETLEVNITKFFVKNISLLGSRSSTRRNQELILELAAAGKIDPIISHRFPLSQVAEGHKVLESARHIGKVVLLPEAAAGD
ncbi:uncharacterized protein Z520_04697 [Fonsecaea multimorphosa CBS 102226]|uniref:Enoyl reductase (ER) domain-containing protein n=1 Tax=Fonsecaea multimorphosa CBS 102226 TaxID=1442371 RepID=A0A0D2IQ85_9EURO|nr:uncharacterized protein Z520_04697 [Fonsecaea multimorphosa CBS 102226]KIX99121.1 hypothetical protein Z520_04697 [Fonsecaea multimorphosa CBS 102226]OAL26032.1 hypothetical protein AYO22_04446 [Fonsecaea multimorphosa]